MDMWHPTGAPRRRLALGAYAGPGNDPDEGPIDLAIIAPSAVEVSRAWLQRSIAAAADRLDREGMLWILVPRRWRGTAERTLGRCQLVQLGGVLAIPRWPDSDHLIPLAYATLRDAGPRHLGLTRVLASMLGGLAMTRMGRLLLSRAAPGCALLAAREPAPPAFRWLGDLDRSGAVTATVSCGPRSDARVAVALRFPPRRGAPDLVVKAALDEAGIERVQAERRALERLAGSAAGAGARVPAPRPYACQWLLATDALAGRPAGAELAASPRRLSAIACAVADWLLRWNTATASRAPATAELLEQLLLGPLERLVAAGVVPEAYACTLAAIAARLQRRELVLVAAHRDLTMSNILLAGSAPGILDWESATATGLPLTDLWYALADGVARATRLTRASAVEALVTGAAPAPTALTQLPAQHAAALRLSVDETMLAFHVCWLGHADNELRRGAGNGPFAGVVHVVAASRLMWPEAS